MNADMTVKATEIIDQWSQDDPLFYSPWGVNVIEHSGSPMIVVGLNIPGLAPLEEGTGAVLSYRRTGGEWLRSVVRSNPQPTVENYNAMIVVSSDIDNDGDEDWVGTTMTEGKAFIVEQVHPADSLIATISLPDGFDGVVTKLLVTLAGDLPVTGPPAAVLAEISNGDSDGDGIGDVDRILGPANDLTLAFDHVELAGDYHVVVALYLEGGGTFQPMPGIDYMAASPKILLGSGQATVDL